jgi:hypothetical protein
MHDDQFGEPVRREEFSAWDDAKFILWPILIVVLLGGSLYLLVAGLAALF